MPSIVWQVSGDANADHDTGNSDTLHGDDDMADLVSEAYDRASDIDGDSYVVYQMRDDDGVLVGEGALAIRKDGEYVRVAESLWAEFIDAGGESEKYE